MKFHYLCLSVICFHLGCKEYAVLGTHEENSWIDPDAWGREQHLQQSVDQSSNANMQNEKESISSLQCDASEKFSNNGEAIALMYYKRLIAYLFNSNSFKHNSDIGLMSRALILTALPEQLEQLKNLSDPRDLDSVLTEILSKARVPTLDDYYSLYGTVARQGQTMGVLALIWDIIKDMGKLLKTSEIQFLLGAASFVLLSWYCHRRYRIGIITMIIGAVICFGYFHTYLECNRKLEAERLLEILARNEKLQQAEPRWYTPFINFFHFNEPDAKQTQREFIKKSSQLNLSFCRPDHVFLLYANDLFLKQLQFLIDKCQESMAILREDLPFPLNYMACVLLVTLIGYIVKLTFKYILSPRAWVGIWHAHNTLPSIGTGTSTGTIHHEDRISGENLRMLLHAISGGATSNQITISNTTATASLTQSNSTGSGVEEIQDALEIGNVDTSNDSAMSEVTAEVKRQDSPQKQTEKLDNNNSSNKSVNILKDKSDVESKEAKLEDVIDEET